MTLSLLKFAAYAGVDFDSFPAFSCTAMASALAGVSDVQVGWLHAVKARAANTTKFARKVVIAK